VACPCGEINCRSFLSKKERVQFEREQNRVDVLLNRQSSVNRGAAAPPPRTVDSTTAGTETSSAYAQVLRQFSPEVADEYERVQQLGRNRFGRAAFAIHPRNGCRVALDYEQPPQLEESPVEYDLDGVTIKLHNSRQSRADDYSVRLTAAMCDELIVRQLAHTDLNHGTYRFLTCRMCPRCFAGPLSEDEVKTLWTVPFECLCYAFVFVV
jgi:hypothetical protein